MKRFKNILFLREPAKTCEAELDSAIKLAKNNQAKLCVIDVVEPLASGFSAIPKGYSAQTLMQAIVDERAERLQHLVGFANKQMPVESQIVTGIPYLETVRKVLRDQHDLVIKPTYSNGSFKERLFGGTDLHLLRKCPVPVWLMQENGHQKINKVMAAIDVGHEDEEQKRDALSLKILELSSSLAFSEFSELHIAHAWVLEGEILLRSGHGSIAPKDVDDYVEENRQRHHRWVNTLYSQATQRLGADALSYLTPVMHLKKGWAKDVIPAMAAEIGCDLVVMGTVARTGIPGFIMGNTAESIINQLNCSVLAVKPEGFVTPVTLS